MAFRVSGQHTQVFVDQQMNEPRGEPDIANSQRTT
jgi:hypothetical protein